MSIGESGSIERRDSTIVVTGAVTFATVAAMLARSRDWIGGADGATVVDLAAVERVDSAGLALLVEWLRLARAGNRELTLMHAPAQVRSLVQVNNLGAAFELTD